MCCVLALNVFDRADFHLILAPIALNAQFQSTYKCYFAMKQPSISIKDAQQFKQYILNSSCISQEKHVQMKWCMVSDVKTCIDCSNGKRKWTWDHARIFDSYSLSLFSISLLLRCSCFVLFCEHIYVHFN